MLNEDVIKEALLTLLEPEEYLLTLIDVEVIKHVEVKGKVREN